ncbi:MAG: MlaD family protein [Lysobacteraceae bacterium]|jgi:phospholipid/cholesterol/gamma-HCH transport system substrate-binding protein|nr:MCE family protein [Xanthomonadaceae bacterium]MCZ8319130.1 MlaD family protein [Silanimonas sp.]
METKANHVLVGAFTVAIVIGGLLFALWAAKALSDRNWDEYDVVFTEAVTGLSRGGVVQYNGIAVGEVRDLSLDPKDPRKVVARIRVASDTPVKTDTTARLAFVGLTGVTQIQLSGGRPASPALKGAVPRDQIPRIAAKESAFGKLLSSSEDITATASEVLVRINRMLNDETVEDFAKTMAHLEQVTGTLAAERGEIATLLRDARSSAARLDRVLAKAETTMDGVDRSVAAVAEDLPALLAKLDQTLVQVEALSRNTNGLVEDNREAVRQFGQTGLAQVGPTLAELRSLLRQLNRAAAKIEESPSNALLGGPAPEEFKP